MTASDADALADLAAELPGNVEPRAELERSGTSAWVAVEDAGSAPFAYAICSSVLDELELLAIATRPLARRRGAAKALLARIADYAREAGAVRITLEVARDNHAARALYERAGFSTFNVRRAYYRQTGQDALEMELSLR